MPTVFLYAFDLLELNGDDLRRDPLQVRKATLASTLAKAGPGIRFNEHLECDDGEIVFRHACKLGLKASCRSARTCLPLWPVIRLAQDEEPGLRGSEARGGKRIGPMTILPGAQFETSGRWHATLVSRPQGHRHRVG